MSMAVFKFQYTTIFVHFVMIVSCRIFRHVKGVGCSVQRNPMRSVKSSSATQNVGDDGNPPRILSRYLDTLNKKLVKVSHMDIKGASSLVNCLVD